MIRPHNIVIVLRLTLEANGPRISIDIHGTNLRSESGQVRQADVPRYKIREKLETKLARPINVALLLSVRVVTARQVGATKKQSLLS